MTTKNIMFYKVFHTDKNLEIRYFDSFENAKNAAQEMIDSFRFWGGGSVPVNISSYKISKAGKYCGMIEDIYFSDDLYIDYARENGKKCGFFNI